MLLVEGFWQTLQLDHLTNGVGYRHWLCALISVGSCTGHRKYFRLIPNLNNMEHTYL